jgi:hypothetical protein
MLTSQRCYDAALNIEALATLYQAQHSLQLTPPTMAQIVYTAGTAFLFAAAQAAHPVPPAEAVKKVRGALTLLNEISATWNAGRQKANILEDLLAAYEEAAQDRTLARGALSAQVTEVSSTTIPTNPLPSGSGWVRGL